MKKMVIMAYIFADWRLVVRKMINEQEDDKKATSEDKERVIDELIKIPKYISH